MSWVDGDGQRTFPPGQNLSKISKVACWSWLGWSTHKGPKLLLAEARTSASAVAEGSSTSWRRLHNTVLRECGVTSVCGHRRPCLRIINCLREMANWSWPLAIPPGVCWASPIHTTKQVGGSMAIVVTSRSPPNCCASSKIVSINLSKNESKAGNVLHLSLAKDPPVITRRRHLGSLSDFAEWRMSKYVLAAFWASLSETMRPIQWYSSVGNCRYCTISIKLRVPVFSLHMTWKWHVPSVSMAIRPSRRIAAALLLPAPKRPCAQTSSLPVARARATALVAATTCPSSSAAIGSTLVRNQLSYLSSGIGTCQGVSILRSSLHNRDCRVALRGGEMASAATFSVSKPKPLTILLEGICATAVSSLAVRVWPMAKTSLTCMCSGIVASVKSKYKMFGNSLKMARSVLSQKTLAASTLRRARSKLRGLHLWCVTP